MTHTKTEQFKKGFEQLDELLEKERAKTAELLEALKEIRKAYEDRKGHLWNVVNEAIKKAEEK